MRAGEFSVCLALILYDVTWNQKKKLLKIKLIFDFNTFYNNEALNRTHATKYPLFQSFILMPKREKRESVEWAQCTQQMCLYLQPFPHGIQRILLSIFFSSVSCQPLWHWWNAAQQRNANFCEMLCTCSRKKKFFFSRTQKTATTKKVYLRDVKYSTIFLLLFRCSFETNNSLVYSFVSFSC